MFCNRISYIKIACAFLLPGICFAQKKSSIKLALWKEMQYDQRDSVVTIGENFGRCEFYKPLQNGDVLINYLSKDISMEASRFRKLCINKCDVQIYFEIVTYHQQMLLSAIIYTYLECNGMPSPDGGSKTVNYLFHNDNVYKITITNTNRILNRKIDSISASYFEKDCIQNISMNREYNLLIDKSLKVNNPLRSKVCDEAIDIGNVVDLLIFKKL